MSFSSDLHVAIYIVLKFALKVFKRLPWCSWSCNLSEDIEVFIWTITCLIKGKYLVYVVVRQIQVVEKWLLFDYLAYFVTFTWPLRFNFSKFLNFFLVCLFVAATKTPIVVSFRQWMSWLQLQSSCKIKTFPFENCWSRGNSSSEQLSMVPLVTTQSATVAPVRRIEPTYCTNDHWSYTYNIFPVCHFPNFLAIM